jgi:galactokinase
MKHYLNDKQMVEDRQRAIQHMLDAQRLAELAQVYRPGLTRRLLAGLGALMVESGTRLKARYEAASTPVTNYQLSVISSNKN